MGLLLAGVVGRVHLPGDYQISVTRFHKSPQSLLVWLDLETRMHRKRLNI